MNKVKRFLCFILGVTFVFSQVPFVSAAEPINEIRDLIDKYYVEEVTEETLAKPTIKEIVDELDLYSTYMTTQEFAELTNMINQEFVGIGVVLEEHQQGVKIVQTVPNGPAEQAGLQADDIITSINGQSLRGESMQTVASELSGEADTFVTVTFLQSATGATLTTTIKRGIIALPNVEAGMLGGDIGYIRLYSFSLDAADEIQKAIQSLNGAKAFIFDLRDNGGGYVSAAQEVLGLFPNVEWAFQLRNRSEVPEVYKALEQTIQFSGPVHILINENSASASEMVSAAVKEQEGAVLYGQTTYGKGSMQEMFILSDESVLKLTTAKFYSPKGTAIHETGVPPTITTTIGEELVASHRDQLINLYSSQYKKMPDLKDVPTTKTFTVKMAKDMNWDTVSSADIHLIHLGGGEVETELTMVGNRTLKVTPKESLLPEAEYMLVIHPNWKTKDNHSMNTGYYLEISVEP